MKRPIQLLWLTVTLWSMGDALQAQNMGINTNTPDNFAILEISSTDKGLLIPRMTVLDVFGRKRIEQFFAANDFAGRSLHLSSADRLPNGMYFLQVRLYDGQMISGKFEVAR